MSAAETITAVAAIIAAAGGGGTAWLISRRSSSGKIGTSEAATLWAASEKMRADDRAQLDKVTEQRDRLMDSQTALVIPMLSGINESLRQITGSLAALENRDG